MQNSLNLLNSKKLKGGVVVFYILYMKIREHFIVSSTCEM